MNTLIIHQSFIDMLASVFLVGLAHIEVPDVHGFEGLHAEVHCFFINCKWPFVAYDGCIKFQFNIS